MFDTILIANRGEIACRVMRTAQAMGVRCVAVYSDVDRDALHVAMADAAVHIGGAQPSDSYLRGGVIIEVAKATGAQAIHPGYGFLSENPEFVEAVEAAGLTFIGPSAQAIRAMGLKDAAKTLMQEVGVPVVPGYQGVHQDAAHLATQAEAIGYPVLIKAVAGGGGKGMRLVEDPAQFAAALSSAKSEAKTAFGNQAVLIEKYITAPRHIEVQVFGDGSKAVHLFERDCSLQRRHQKVIEEAPAPGMTPHIRAAMGDAAIRAAEAIGYAGAGTVEFIVDGSDGLRADGFWFMEMNTRLQVEHPVTEAVTGIDLVAWQLRVAAGEGLPATQADISLKGHAFEARLYAENVPKGFLPATGHLAQLAFPPDVRADTGVRSGDEISPFYDPMIAKLVCHGPTRDVALRKLTRALAGTQVVGAVTNLSFLGALSQHAGFAKGKVDTNLIARDLDMLVIPTVPAPADIALAGIFALGLQDGADRLTGFTLWQPLTYTVKLRREEALWHVALTIEVPGRYQVSVDNTTITARHGDAGWTLDGQSVPDAMVLGEKVIVFTQFGLEFVRIDPLNRKSNARNTASVIEAPMPGLLKHLSAQVGQTVHAGDRLAVLEAMKMEHSLTAPRAGIVADVMVAEGAQVHAGMALIRLADEKERPA